MCYNVTIQITLVICLRTVKSLNSSIWFRDVTLSDTTTPGQSRSASNGHAEVLYILPNSKTEASQSDGLVS